jgi:hypothetical protein
MQRAKEIFKPIRKIIRLFDFFGEPFTFRYKDENKHATALGGLICILFMSLLLYISDINLFLFITKKISHYNIIQ